MAQCIQVRYFCWLFSDFELHVTHILDYSHPNSLAMPTPVSIVDGETSAYHHDPQYSHHSTAHLVSSYGTYQSPTTDYHVQSAMTPPSSVSPRDSNNTTISHNNYNTHLPNGSNDGSSNGSPNAGVIGLRCNRSL